MTKPIEVIIVAVPQTAGSALYGMLDVLLSAGNIWQTLARTEPSEVHFQVRILSPTAEAFTCGNGIPIQPHVSVKDDPDTQIVILPELWLGPDEHLKGNYPELMEWILRQHKNGAYIYSACSGAIMLAETGLLNGCDATSHWGYKDLFQTHYPEVVFKPEPSLAFADEAGRVVTAGGTTSWHDLAIHIISKHVSPGEALRIAQVYLLKWHSEGQLPYQALIRNNPHTDSVVADCENWLKKHFCEDNVLQGTIAEANIPQRTLKRRFKRATGSSLIEYLQNLRVEEAKRMLETKRMAVDDISYEVGYEDASFFRRLFKRRTGLTPSQYRRMFRPVIEAGL